MPSNLPLGSPWPLIEFLVPLWLLYLTARIALRTKFEAMSLARLRQYFLTSIAIFVVMFCIKLSLPHSIVGYLAPLWCAVLAVVADCTAMEHYRLRSGNRVSWLAFTLLPPREWIPPRTHELTGGEI